MANEAVPGRGQNQYFVRNLAPGSPAKAAGLRQGDLLLAMNGRELATVPLDQFLAMNAALVVGETVTYRILRGGTEQVLRMKAAKSDAQSIETWVAEHVRTCHGEEDYHRYLLQLKAADGGQRSPP